MHPDFKELLSAFDAGQVRYLIVGGYAVSFHAQPRATKDLDILIGADAENSRAVYAALAKFGALIEGLSTNDFAELDNCFRMGTPPVMVVILPKISGVEFDEAWRRRVDVQIDDYLTASFISHQDLLVAKVSAGRAQDLIDVDALSESLKDRQVEHPPYPAHLPRWPPQNASPVAGAKCLTWQWRDGGMITRFDASWQGARRIL